MLPKDPIKAKEYKEKLSAIGKGHPVSKETREKISKGNKGKLCSEEHRKKISDANKGKVVTEETRKKLSKANKGRPLTYETRIKLSEAKKGRRLTKETKMKLSQYCGPLAHTWKGGISFEPYCIKFNDEFKERVRAFFGYQCVECGEGQSKKKLDIHHVTYNKKVCCDTATPLFVPLCHSCHGKTQKNRLFWEYWFTEMISHLYGGKCYFTKEEMKVYGKI